MRDPNNPASAARRQQPTPPTKTEPEQQQQSAASGPGAAGAFPLSEDEINRLADACVERLILRGFNDCEALIIEMLEKRADTELDSIERWTIESQVLLRKERAKVLRETALAIRLGQHRRQPPAAEGQL